MGGRVFWVAVCGVLWANSAFAQGTISGSVKRQRDGVAAPGVTVNVYGSFDSLAGSATTDAAGNYSVTNLFAFQGPFYVVTSNSGGLADQIWKGSVTTNVGCTACAPLDTGTAVTVVDLATTSGINFELPDGARVSGRVTDASGVGIPGVAVTFGGRAVTTRQSVAIAPVSTDSNGNFSVAKAFAAGEYGAFTRNTVGYIDQLFGGTLCTNVCATSSSAPIVVGADAVSVTFALAPGGSINGFVTNAATSAVIVGATVLVANSGGVTVASITTNVVGGYSSPALPDGQYYVKASPAFGSPLLPKLHSNITCPTGCETLSGTPITLTSSTVASADFKLEASGTLRGTVREALTGAPLNFASVSIFNKLGQPMGSGFTDPAGAYSVTGLITGSYFVRANGSFGAPYFGRVYATASGGAPGGASYNCTTCASTEGTPVAVTAGSTTSGIDFALERGTGISGYVIDAATGAGAFGVSVLVLNSSGATVAFGSSDFSSGAYTIGPLATGRYWVKTGTSAANYLPEIYKDGGATHVICVSCSVSLGTPIDVVAGVNVTDINFRLTPGRTISGTVTTIDGVPMSSVSVSALNRSGLPAGSGFTNASGVYTVQGLAPGTYVLQARPFGSQFFDQYYHRVTCANCSAPPSSATAVDVRTANATDKNFYLDIGGRFSGRVLGPDGLPVAGASVTLYTETGGLAGVTLGTDTAGNYLAGVAIPTGQYFAMASAPGLVPELYNSIPSCTGCSPLTGLSFRIAAGSNTTGINFRLGAGGRISGTVKDSSGAPIAGVAVTATTTSSAVVGTGRTNLAGGYTIGLPAGVYFLQAAAGGPYLDSLYDGSTCIGFCTATTGTPVRVVAGGLTTGIDFALSSGGSISGVVLDAVTSAPLAGATVSAYNSAGLPVRNATVRSDGSYTLEGLAAGNYFARSSNTLGYLDLLLATPNQVCGLCTVTTGDPIPVTAGADTPGIHFFLNRAGSKGSVSGRVTEADGVTPLAGVTVNLSSASGAFAFGFGTSDDNGFYTIANVDAGDYFLKTANVFGFLDQLLGGAVTCADCPAGGQVVKVTQGEAVAGKDFALAAGGKMSGVVTGPTGTLLAGVMVSVLRPDGLAADAAITLSDGSWITRRGLPSGVYTLRAQAAGFLTRTAGPVTVTGSSAVTGINVSLAAGGIVRGRVLAGGAPAPGVGVSLYSSASGSLPTGSATTGGDGVYLINGLTSGTYFLRTATTSGYVNEIYSGMTCIGDCSPLGGTPVTVTEGAVTSGIDFSLAPGGTLTGTVMAAAGGVVGGTAISAYSTAGALVASGTTAPNGVYFIRGLAAGSYLVRTTSNPAGLINMVHGSPDAVCVGCSTSLGTPVTVVADGSTTVNFSLPAGGTINGTVRLAAGGTAGPGDVTVTAYTMGGVVAGTAVTRAGGTYTISGLPSGAYALITTNFVNLVNQLYNGHPQVSATPLCATCGFPTATQVAVTAGSSTGGIDFSLTRGGTISGIVRDAATNAPLAGISVSVSSSSIFVSNTSTDANGAYVLDRLPTGVYSVATLGFTSYVHVTLPKVAVTAGQTTANTDFALSKGGSISGTVTDAGTGQPIASVVVNATSMTSGTTIGAAFTDATGAYTVNGLASGTYAVSTASFGGSYIDRVYDAIDCVLCLAGIGKPVSVTAGSTTSGINLALKAGGRVSGTVTDAATHAPIAGASVIIYDASGIARGSGVTNASGVYTSFGALSTGTYYAVAAAFGYAGKLFDVFPCLSCTASTGKPIAVTAGSTTTGIDFALAAGVGQISGTISGGGVGLNGASVGVYDSTGTFVTSAVTTSGGSYVTPSLPPGTYYVTAGGSGFVNQLYDGAGCGGSCAVTTGKPVTVAAAATTSGIDFNLTPGGRIAGTVVDKATGQPLGGVLINVYNSSGTLVATASSDELGAYATSAVPSGNYYARASGKSLVAGAYIDKLYADTNCPVCSPLSGAPIAVTVGAVSRGVDFALETGEVIRGTVTDQATGRPISATVYLYDSNGKEVANGATNAVGAYSIAGGVPGGRYYAVAVALNDHVDRLYDGLACLQCDYTRGTPIDVDGAGETTGINFALSAGSRIRGTVTAASGGAGIGGVRVRFYNAAGNLFGQAVTDASGAYVSRPLPAGSYYVRTANLFGFADKLYSDVTCVPCTFTSGALVALSGGGTKSGIDLSLERGGILRGYVRDALTLSPIAGAVVSVYAAGTTTLVAETDVTDALGQYAVSLPVGQYDVDVKPVAGFRPSLNGLTSGSGVRLAVTIAAGGTASTGFQLASCPAITVAPATLPPATLGQAYSKALSASGGTGAYQFSVAAGSVPGVTLSTAGVLSGAPTAAGTAKFTAAAVDSTGCAATAAYSLHTCSIALTVSSTGVGAGAGTGSAAFLATSTDCAWTAVSNAPWLTVTSASSGAGAGTVTFSYQANPGATTTRTGTITIGGQTFTVLQSAGSTQKPFGVIDGPVNNTTNIAGAIAIAGWALDDLGVARVEISRDPVAPEPAGTEILLGDAVSITGARPDIVAAFPSYAGAHRAGWGYLLLTNLLPAQGNGAGNGTYVLHVDVVDLEGNKVRIGDRTIIVSNATATKPFGTIDTPAQGATISGTSYPHFGWMLTPLPKTMPKDGSTIKVFVDGIELGALNYNHFRSDIAAAFPGLNNTGSAASGEGAIGFRHIDTTQFADGVHTIGWLGTDDAGVAEGVGSRYFTIMNGASQRTAGEAAASTMTASQAAELQQHDVPSRGRVRAAIGAERLQDVSPNGLGEMPLTLGSLERLEVRFGASGGCVARVSGGAVNGDRAGALPVGSALRGGRFYWQPGPAFKGDYAFSFTVTSCDGTVDVVKLDVQVTGVR